MSGSGSGPQNRVRAGLTSWGLRPHTQPSPTQSCLKFQSSSFIRLPRKIGTHRRRTKTRRLWVTSDTGDGTWEGCEKFLAAPEPKRVLTARRGSAGGMRVSHTQWKSCESTASQRGQNTPRAVGGKNRNCCAELCVSFHAKTQNQHTASIDSQTTHISGSKVDTREWM